MNSMNKNVQPTPSSCSIYNQHYTFGLERVSRRRNSISSSDFLNLFYGIPCMALNQQDIVSLVPVDISPFHCLNKSVRKLSLCIMQEDCQCYFMCSFFCFLAFSAVIHRNDFILLIFFALFSHVWPNPTDFSVIYSDSIIRIQLRLLQALADSTVSRRKVYRLLAFGDRNSILCFPQSSIFFVATCENFALDVRKSISAFSAYFE